MLVWTVTIVLALVAVSGWLLINRDPDRYIHEKTSPINIFFKWGRSWHHVFKITTLVFFMAVIFSLYRYFLDASQVFSTVIAIMAGITLATGKELLDKAITKDDVISSISGIIAGFLAIYLFF